MTSKKKKIAPLEPSITKKKDIAPLEPLVTKKKNIAPLEPPKDQEVKDMKKGGRVRMDGTAKPR
jgi:hypothetical protein|tara:strand:- start:237 stop:428 length:192 start_codon:yes stop_codon:yes gene_type:complete